MKRVLVTGARGFVGTQVVPLLLESGFEVHTVGRTRGPAGVRHHRADLLDRPAVRTVVAAARATHLLHLAWDVTPGSYSRAASNLDWVAASAGLIRAFVGQGGQRIVGAGTCAEYAWGPARLDESARCEPATLYGVCKDAVRRVWASYGATAGVSVAWGRVFFLYGPGEPQGRLVGDAVRALRAGERFEASHGLQRRDFLHVADVAGAFAALLACDVQGAVNIGSGVAIPVRTVLELIASRLGGTKGIAFGARALSAGEPDVIEAAIGRLHDEVGFRPRFSLEAGIDDTLAR